MLRHSKQLISVTMIAHATKEHVRGDVTQQLESCRKRCCRAFRHQADSAAAMEQVIPCHQHQLRNGVFCGSAPRLYHYRPSWVELVEWNRVESRVRQLESSSARELQWDRRRPARTCSREHWSWGIYSFGGLYETTGEHITDCDSTCRSELQNVRISDSAIVTCTYDL
jgi:hypothetical protein